MSKEYIERETKVDKTTDYVSRKKCLDIFFKLFVMEDTRIAEATEEEIFRFQHALGMTPAEDVEPVKHGEWIYDHWCEFKCSECGQFSDSKPYKGKENYCPNCGADMRGVH